jgi:glycosyltransferase involved in cell wall biosynthesis
MGASLPVVATRCGGPEDIINNGITGSLVENGSPGAVADSIERLRIDPGARRRLGDAARTRALEHFSLAAQVRAYEQLYTECLLQHRRGWRQRRYWRRPVSMRLDV